MAIDIDHLIATCAADISVSTMKAIIKIESSNNPWIIYDNTTKQTYKLSTKDEAIAKAEELFNQGNNIDIGLAQINSSNLTKLDLSIKDVVEPCINLEASSIILSKFYISAKQKFKDKQQALFHAISAYNTGSFYNGLGYAKKVWIAANGNSDIINYNFATNSKFSPYNAPIEINFKTDQNIIYLNQEVKEY